MEYIGFCILITTVCMAPRSAGVGGASEAQGKVWEMYDVRRTPRKSESTVSGTWYMYCCALYLL